MSGSDDEWKLNPRRRSARKEPEFEINPVKRERSGEGEDFDIKPALKQSKEGGVAGQEIDFPLGAIRRKPTGKGGFDIKSRKKTQPDFDLKAVRKRPEKGEDRER